MAKELTDKQRAAVEAVQSSRAGGLGVSAYAKAHGLSARQLHDSIAGLRRRGVLPPTDRPRRRKGSFVAVRVENGLCLSPAMPTSPRTGMVCRVVHASGLVIECADWPAAAWLQSLAPGPGPGPLDAAT